MTAANDMTLIATRIVAGVWEGVLTGSGAEAPALDVTHLGRALEGVQVLPGAVNGAYAVRVPIPVEALSDGVQTFLIRAGGETLAHFTVIAGVPMEADLRAEIDLLRAELDMLKRVVRRHFAQTAG
jgi:hypothetical protein